MFWDGRHWESAFGCSYRFAGIAETGCVAFVVDFDILLMKPVDLQHTDGLRFPREVDRRFQQKYRH